MAYQYNILTHGFTAFPDTNGADSEEYAGKLGRDLEAVVQRVNISLLSRPAGPWEIVSHTVTYMGQHLIMSFLIRTED